MCLHAELFILKLDVAQIPIFNFLFYKFDLPLKFIMILKKIIELTIDPNFVCL